GCPEMDLRKELMPPALDESHVVRLARLADQIVDRIDRGVDPDPLIAAFNEQAATALTRSDFHAFPGCSDATTFVRDALTLPPPRIPDIGYDELLELVTRVCTASGTEHENNYWLELLEANIPDPQLSDLIYWPG